MSWATTLGVVASVGIAIGATVGPAAAQPPSFTVSDDFSGGYGGGTNWGGTSWDETNETDDPNAGRIRIVDQRLQFTDLDDRTIFRGVDLSAHAAHDVVLSFDWFSESSDGEELWVELRDSSNSWVRVAELDDNDHSPLPVTLSVQLEPDLVSASSGIRFRSNSNDVSWSGGEQFVIDNVRFDVDTISDNPDLPVSCGIDVTIVLDESGSIQDATNGIAEVENAVRSLVDGLKNTGSTLRFTEFSTNGRAAVIGGSTDFQVVDAAFEAAVETYLGNGGNAQNADNYNPGVGEEWTNWEAGLAPTTANPGDLVVFITDGQPNTIGTAGTSVPGEFSNDRRVAAAAALDELDAIKATGAHVLAIGVGAASSQTNFDLLTRTVQPGTAQIWEGTGELDLSVTDAIRVTTFDALDNALRQIVFALCAPSVSITKVDDAGAPIQDWAFGGTVDVIPQGGGTDQFEWVSPTAGSSPPATATQTATTDSNGVALFQWTPNTVADPEPWDSSFSFTETLLPGWTPAAQQAPCAVQRLDGNGDVQNLTADLVASRNGDVVTFTLEVPGSNNPFLLAKSDIMTCEVRNDRPARIVIEKTTLPTSQQAFGFTGSNGIGSFAVAGGSSTELIVPAGTYTIGENTPPANWHLTGVSGEGCTTTQNEREISVTVAPNQTITCTFTNSGTANLKLEKEWVVGRVGDTADLATIGGFAGEINYQSVSDGTDLQLDTGGPTIEVPIGSPVTLNEVVVPGPIYTSELDCRDDVDGSDVFVVNFTAPDGRSGSITAGEGAVGATITCTFSNPRREAMIVVEKNLVPATDDGRFDLRVNGVTVVDDGGDGASNAAAPVIVKVGDAATVAEFAADGNPVSADYGSAVNCVGLGELIVGTTSVTFDIPADAADQTITCTFTNTRKSASLTVEKTWVDAKVGDAVSITTTGAANDVDFAAAANAANETDTDPTTYTVFAGETLSFSEVFTTGDPAGYATSLSCTGATDADPNDGLTIGALDNGAQITCTYTNTRNSATFTLDKEWVLANAGDAVDLDANGSDVNAEVIDTSSTAPISAGGSMTVYSGELVDFSETFTTGTADNYNTTLVCQDGAGPLLSTSSLSGRLTVASDPTDIICTFTNTLKTSSLVVQKTWVDGNAGDTADLTAGAANATSTSTGALGSETDVANQAFLPEVFVGQTIPIAELISAPANYDTTWSCDDAAQTSGTGTSGQVTIAPADEDQQITCTFTNTRKRANLVVTKSWADSPDNDDSVSLAIAGGDAPAIAGSSTNGGDPGDRDAASVVFAGEEVTFSETFGGAYGANYDAEWACDDGAQTSGSGTVGGLTVVAADQDTTITCTFTNTRKRADLTLTKVWNGSFDGDAVDLAISSDGEVGNGSSIAPGASTTDATLTVYAGDSVSLSETFSIGSRATYDTTLSCTEAGSLTTGTNASTVSGSFVVPSDPVAQTCAFTNAGIPDVSVAKEFVFATDDDFDGVYDVRYTVTVTNSGPGAQTYDLSDTPAFDDDLAIISGTASAVGGPADPGDWAGAPWTLATGQAIAGSTGVSIVHLYTLDFVVDAGNVIEGQGSYDPCDGQEPVAGEGLFNTATLTIDQEGTDAIDCGDIDPPDLDLDKQVPVIDGPDADGKYTVTYDVLVTNSGTVPTQYTLVDEPAFSPGLVVESGSATVVGHGNAVADYAGSPWTLAGDPATPPGDDQLIGAGATHTYTLVFVVDGSAILDGSLAYVPCQDLIEAGQGVFNSATLRYTSERLDDQVCGDPDIPVVNIAKQLVSATDADADGIYDVVYSVEVTNGSSAAATYDLTDTPGFDDDLVIVSGSAVGSGGAANPAPYSPPPATWTLATGHTIASGATHTYELNFVVDATALIEPSGDPLPALTRCDVDDPTAGEGLFNEATLQYAGQTKTADDCGDPLLPDLDLDKSVTSVSGPDSDGRYTVVYEITVDNTGDGATAYDLDDTPAFDADLVISGTPTATGSDGSNPIAVGAYGSPTWELVDDQPITAGASHTYELTFVVDGSAVIANPDALTECGTIPVEGRGLFNTATLSYADELIDDSDCGDPDVPVVDIAKTFVSAVDANADGVYTVRYDIAVSNGDVATTYDLSDTPGFDSDLTISGTPTATGSDGVNPIATGPYTAGTWNLVSGRAIAANGTHTFELTFEVDATALIEPEGDPLPALDPCDPQGPAAGESLFNAALLTYAGLGKPAADCGDPDLPDLELTKSVVSLSGPAANGTYTVVYDVVVTNSGEGATTYTLGDTPTFSPGLVIESGSALGTGGAADPADYSPPPATWNLATDHPIAAAAEHTYTLVFVVDGSGIIENPDLLVECGSTPVAGQGFFNSTSLTYTDEVLDDDDCVTPGVPTISVEKEAGPNEPVHAGGNDYTVTYTVTVSNVGDTDGAYSLSDVPDFGTGATVVNIGVAGNGIVIGDYTAGDPIVTDEALAAGDSHVYEVTVDLTVAPDMARAERTCTPNGGQPGEATYNQALITYNEGGTDEANDCVNIPQPSITFVKALDGDPVRDAETGVWTVTYELTVTSAADGGPATYDLDDAFLFGEGVSIVADTATASNTTPGDIVTNADFDGVLDTQVVADQAIEPGGTHTYAVSVQATVEVGDVVDGDCVREDEGGTGFLNEMILQVGSGDPEITDACAGFATLTLQKEVVNDDGGNAVEEDFTLTARREGLTLSGDGFVSSAVPAGLYDLSESSVAGYTPVGDFTCTAGELGQGLTLADGDNAVCTIVNDDDPIDLELTKDDGGFEAIAGGDPIPYTISVRNIGTRDVDLGEPVTVIDVLPDGLSWSSFPSNCSAAGATLTCDLDPVSLPAGGSAIVIDTLVDVAPDADSGTYQNRAWVDTEDDPVCEGEGCEPPPCPAPANNNVDCDETPVDGFATITIVKTDDVADGDSVEPGDAYSYTLVVTNNGPSTVLPGLVVADDLPMQLELVSTTGGAGWTCNSDDPVECTYGPSIAPGATTTPIIVTVAVVESATGSAIDNVAVATGRVDQLCPSIPSGLIQSELPCGEVSDDDDETTPLEANADLAIEKSASIDQAGAGGEFTWILDVTNNGPGTAFGVEIGDLVPAAVTVTGVASTDFDCDRSGNDVSCTVASLAVGASGRVTITVSVPATAPDGSVVNVATVEAETPDPDLGNNSDDAEVAIVAQAVVTTTLPPVTLPRTGSDSTSPITKAAWLLLLAGFAVTLAARRRPETTDEV